jgi:hypothetical protein
MISVGTLAQKDPVIAFSSVMASSLLLKASRLPRSQRLEWLRSELNKTQPGIGDDVLSKYRQLKRGGESPNQAIFDAMRLTLANRLANHIDRKLPRHSAAGLGDTASDVRLAMCTGYGIGAGGGGATAGFLGDPAASVAVTDAMRVAAEIQGCNLDQLMAQARIAEATARTAEASAASGAAVEDDAISPGVMIALGVGGVALIGLIGYAVVKK